MHGILNSLMTPFDLQVQRFIAFLETEKSEIYVRVNEDLSVQEMLKSCNSGEVDYKFNERIAKLKAKRDLLKEAIAMLEDLIKPR